MTYILTSGPGADETGMSLGAHHATSDCNHPLYQMQLLAAQGFDDPCVADVRDGWIVYHAKGAGFCSR